jgi:hypothetical protein
MATKQSSGQSSGKKVAEGIGIAALAAGAAAAYYFSGKGGQAKRTQAKAWVKSAKSEMAQKIKGMEKLSKVAYEQAGKEILAKYKQAKNIDPKELAAFAQELKGHWDEISKHVAKLNSSTKAKSIKAPAKKKAKK